MGYIPPSSNDVLFEFDSAGYHPPNFNDVNFNFGAVLKLQDLKNIITGMELQPDYLKSCDTYVVAHETGIIQTFRSNCVYAGFRDLQVMLVLSTSCVDDISAYIKSTMTGYLNLGEVLKAWNRGLDINLYNAIKVLIHENEVDLSLYIKQGTAGQVNILKRINVFQHTQSNFRKIIKGCSTSNIVDLVNVIRIGHTGVVVDLGEYIKSIEQLSSDLILDIFKIWGQRTKDIGFVLHSWQVVDLQQIITSLHTYDLNVMLRSTFITNITALLNAVTPVDIKSELHSWQLYDLSASISLGIYGGDLSAQLYGIDSVDLNTSLVVKRGIQVIKDLNCYTTNLKISNLQIALNTIDYRDLNVYLMSSRQLLDLQCMIYPKVVFVRHNINVSFLEHRDLSAAINFSCFSSSFRDLQFSLFAKHRKDLIARIWGAEGSNIVDLTCYINSYDYVTIDVLQARSLNLHTSITRATLKYKKSNIFSIDSILVFNTNVHKAYRDLVNSITGTMLHSNLNVKIRPYSNKHYNSPSVFQKFITLKLKNNAEEFRRYVELTFNSYVSNYYYFSGNKRAYREFRDDHWVVKVEGYKTLPIGRGFEKVKVRRKYIFNLGNYDSIDDAIRDMIDRVTAFRSVDLKTLITPITHNIPTSDAISDLGINIISKRVYYSNRVLPLVVMTTTHGSTNLLINIFSSNFLGTKDIVTTINGTDYEGPTNGTVNFNFIGSGDTQPEADDVGFTFTFGVA